MGKLFGTDGIRGVVNAGLDAELAYKVGLAAAKVLAEEKNEGKPLFTIGNDTRISCDLLKGALIAGLCSAGADVLDLGTIPTPAVAWVTVDQKADAGIVISASHNPFEHNGIKIFNGQGFKLSDELEEKIEEVVLSGAGDVPRKTHGELGKVRCMADKASEDYIVYLTTTVKSDLSGLRILVDCANGASSATAARLFAKFPALQANVINGSPDGVNINNGCGSTHLDMLAEKVKAGGYDIGIAFDGDADRCLAVDENGEEIDGDQIMAICGLDMMRAGKLPGNAIVATVMSNLGLRLFARDHGMTFLATNVGDRHVLEKMEECGYTLGGEQSGHMIFREFATTGDGQLSALQVLQVLHKSGLKASELFSQCKKYPQYLINVPVADNAMKAKIMSDPTLSEAIEREEAALAGAGRVLIRPSGTEALIRVMVEGSDPKRAETCAQNLANFIKSI